MELGKCNAHCTLCKNINGLSTDLFTSRFCFDDDAFHFFKKTNDYVTSSVICADDDVSSEGREVCGFFKKA